MTRDRSAAHNLLAGTITKYLLLAVSIATGIFLMPFTVHHLGKSQYGLWMLVASVTYYFGLLDLGYGNGVVRHIVEADARGDTAHMNRIVSTFVCVYSVIGVAACALGAVLVLYAVPRFPKLSPSDVRTGQAILAILCARLAIGYPMTVFGAIVNARQGFVLNNSIATGLVVLNAAVTYALLEAGGGVVLLVLATTALSIAGYGAYAWSARHVFPELQIRVRHFSREDWRDVTAFSTYLFIVGIGSQLSFNVDNVVVGAYLGTAAVAVYAVAARLAEYQRRVCDQFSGMLFPVVVGFGARGEDAALRASLLDGTRVSNLLVVGVTTSLAGFAQPLMLHWMGPGFEGSVASFYVLAVVGVFMVSHAAGSSVLLATGCHRLVAGVWVAEGLANLLLSVLLVRRFGAVGVALGSAIPMAIGHVGVLMPAACRRVGMPIGRYLRSTLIPALAGGIPAAAACFVLRIWLPPGSTRMVLTEAAAVGVLYCAIATAAGLDRPTRDLYVEQVLAACRVMVPKRVALPETH